MGCWTEPFNRMWFMRETGLEVINAGKSMACPWNLWRLCTLDGQVPEKGNAIWEAKHTGAFSKPEEILARYAPQLQHNMAVCGVDLAILSVIYGNHKWEIYEVAADWLYQEELLEAERRFWGAVESGDCPVAVAAPPPPKPIATREVDMSGSNSWAARAADWLTHREAARVHADAAKELKALVEDDVSRAFGHGIEIKRSKAGALTVKEMAS
jgi:predicted phage-related endonuclease